MALIYQYGFFILIGIIAGIFIALKWLAPEGTEVKVGKFVIRGRQHTVSDMLDMEIRPAKKLTWKEKRQARKAAKNNL